MRKPNRAIDSIVPDDYNFSKISETSNVTKPQGRVPKNWKDTINMFLTFDIETTRIPEIEQSFMYIWQLYDGNDIVIGRTWDEFKMFFEKLSETLGDRQMIVYVHNLSFEFVYLSGIYEFTSDDVFCTDSRKILKCTMYGNIEFRCSYQLSNMSLRRYLQTYGVENQKGELDYTKIRYPWTELDDDELSYCVNDVVGLHQAITKHMEVMKVNLCTIPLTSTGFVRKDVKKAMRSFNYYQRCDMQPNMEIYLTLRDAFRGGNTHGNRFYTGDIVENVSSADRVSSYPDVMMNHMFPMKPFRYTLNNSIQDIMRYMAQGRPVLMKIAIFNLRLKNPMEPVPYLPRSKCEYISNGHYDNGRVLSADYLETSMTDIDFRIFLSMYDADNLVGLKVFVSYYDYLPKCFTDVIMKYYRDKTKLKGGDEILYAVSKGLLNATYGMTVQDPCKQLILYDNGEYVEDTRDLQEMIDLNQKKAFICYQWGVWVSAWARWELQEAINLCGDKFLYADTDSVKYLDKVDFTEYNNRQIEKCLKSGAYAEDSKGNVYYTGVYEPDGEYRRFVHYGAKKYAYEDMEGKLHITIAGVDKKKGAKELEDNGGLEALQEGFIFREGGGNEAVYNDEPYGYYNGVYISRNVTIKPSTYTFGLSGDYERLLEAIKYERLPYDNGIQG